MARHIFPADVLFYENVNNTVVLAADAPIRVWSDRAGGTDYTASMTDVDGVTSLIHDSNGNILADGNGVLPWMMGPDTTSGKEVAVLYVDAGYGVRYPIYASDALTPLVSGELISTVKNYGAVLDARQLTTASISSSSTDLTCVGAFTSADVGKTVAISGAGPSAATLVAIISNYTDANTVVISTPASTTVSGASVWVGTDDTAAINIALAAATVGSKGLTAPNGTALITSPLVIGAYAGWSFSGPSRRAFKIVQASDNTPIFSFTDTGSSRWIIEKMTVSWATKQSSTATAAAGFYFGSGGSNPISYGHYGWIINEVRFENGYLGIGQADPTSSLPLWGCSVENLDFATWTGTAIRFVSTGGSPSIRISNVYIAGLGLATGLTTYGVIGIQGARGVSVSDIEFNDVNSTSGPEMRIENSWAVTLRNIRTERGTVSSNLVGLFRFAGCGVTIDSLEVQSKTVAPGSGNHVFIINGASTSGRIKVTNLKVSSPTITNGTFWCFRSQGIIVQYDMLDLTSATAVYTGDTPTAIYGVSNGANTNMQWGTDTTVGRVAVGAWGTTTATNVLVTGRGTSGARPSASTVGAGATYYDTTLSIPIWSNGTIWKDADNHAV